MNEHTYKIEFRGQITQGDATKQNDTPIFITFAILSIYFTMSKII